MVEQVYANKFGTLALVLVLAGCDKDGPEATPSPPPAPVVEAPRPPPLAPPTEPPPPELLQPVELWRDGKPAGQVDAQGPDKDKYVFLDLGEGWTPLLFTDGLDWRKKPVPHKFRTTYLSLARGEFPHDAYGERAKEDKYLELYGIMPSVAALRGRMSWARSLECAKTLDLTALQTFDGVVAYDSPSEALRKHAKFAAAEQVVQEALATKKIASLEDSAQLDNKQKAQLAYYLEQRDDDAAIQAAQLRLECEGYFKNKGKWVRGAFDWPTHEALAEFERRHRVFSWGVINAPTLAALRMDTAEAERQAVLRVLTERAMHSFGALEDGSAIELDGTPAKFIGADGNEHEVPNLEAQLRDAVAKAFGLADAETTFAFLESLGKLEKNGHHFLAIDAPPRPEYHTDDMDLVVGNDRGDVWYEFPYDQQGRERAQAVNVRPHTNLFVNYLGQRIPIASYGTTIGGWKSELIEGSVWWKYKESPAGEVLWKDIVSAPVWLPPSSTPPRDLLKRKKKGGGQKWEPNYHETGPSYASAYGLVAAYHRPFERTDEGGLRITGDDGIRSHGSVAYMSIMRTHSHGCHRLHNHIAVRLFSFVLNHRPHIRTGHQETDFTLEMDYDGEHHKIEIKEGGYVFRLNKPIFVTVEEGHIKGVAEHAIENPIPKFNAKCKAYYLPDGGVVAPQPDGTLLAAEAPLDCDPELPPLPPPPAGPGTTPPIPGVTSSGQPELVNTQPAAAQTQPDEKLGAGTP
ncbi:MAG TPA: hypothetical protein VFX59_28945 [Polyangiales bacterium]|nr:hypothetical protein [Polyangiales bacterium]